MISRHPVFYLFLLSLVVCNCKEKTIRFELIDPDDSGIHFANMIYETDSVHYFNFPYIYTGAGVGICDINNDGLPDIFFSGNMVSSRLYLNKGNFQFEDITRQAGVETDIWGTGVSVADVNQDGWDDIYLCVSGFGKSEQRKNRLFINNKDLSFTESSEAYGVADRGHSTQAAFFDYDRDGDLDLYVMTHANEGYGAISKLFTYKDGTGPSTDRLYENLGVDSLGHPFYQDISKRAGITIEGYGLGLSISDLNQDGWPDIYVANDFIANDLMYINQQDGSFVNRLSDYTQHSSQNGMGVDIADINHDELPDIVVMDMLPESNHRQKTMTSNMNYDYFNRMLSNGFSPQFIKNTLQLHRGLDSMGNPAFSEVGRMVGIHQTDWSWAPLFADFDHDGWLDLFITNGFRRDVTDHDFQEYHEQTLMTEQGTGELSIPKVLEQLFQLDSVCLPNYIFQNKGGLTFENQTENWGLSQPSMSNGAAYADFDNDGDLDLAVNNINAPAFIYKNNSDQYGENHYLKINFSGPVPNRNGVGAKVIAHLPGGSKSFAEHYSVRGYMSNVSSTLHLGLGKDSLVAGLEVIWPDGKKEYYPNLKADSTYLLEYGKGANSAKFARAPINRSIPSFKEVSNQVGINHLHIENKHSDFKLEPLIPHLYDNQGPGIAVGDMNGDGREDFYTGGARGQNGTLYFQQVEGTFTKKELPGSDFEDMGALLFDADQDGDLDLYVVSGGSSVKYFQKGHYQDRLYINDGRGIFTHRPEALPEMPASGSCVIATDIDGDQDWDLFVGGRIVPGKFPENPRSYILENRNGEFTDVTEELAPGLAEIGMVSSALWTDYDHDQDQDLMIVGEWMPITAYENQNGQFQNTNLTSFQASFGWWNSLIGGDMDDDGDIDYIAGNLGANTSYKINAAEPVRVYAKDFDQNGSIDAIVTKYIQGREHPVAPRGAMTGQIESIRRLFPNYKEYSEADIHQILAAYDTTDLQILKANYFLSSYIENLGDGKFKIHPLPPIAQMGPLFGLEIVDANADGHLDIVGVGNYYPTEIISGWYDANKGINLQGDGKGGFSQASRGENGFWVEGDARALARITTINDECLIMASVNNDHLKVFRLVKSETMTTILFLPGEIRAEIKFDNGRIRKYECYQGQGYLTQSSCTLEITADIQSVALFNRAGLARKVFVNQLSKVEVSE